VNNADGLPTAVMEEVPKDLSEQVDDGLTLDFYLSQNAGVYLKITEKMLTLHWN